jgi:hypothetical protein
MIGFLIFAVIAVAGITYASKSGLFKHMAAQRWGLPPGEKMLDAFTIAKAQQPLSRGQTVMMNVANVVGIFAGFRVGQGIELMSMLVTDHRVIWALQHGNHAGPRVEFSAAAPAQLLVRSAPSSYQSDGIHETRIVTLTAAHLDQDYALLIPSKFLNSPPPYMTVFTGD